jgi:dihydrofolate reductase
MVRRIVAGLAMTLDGVVESPTPTWMRFDQEVNDVISAGIAEADAILLGRNTYLQFAELWPALAGTSAMADFMNNSPKYIVSSSLTQLQWSNSTLLTGELAPALAELKNRPGKNIQVPGSPRLVSSLVREGLLDELNLMLHPIVLGTGACLFDGVTKRVELELVRSDRLANGVVVLTYGRQLASRVDQASDQLGDQTGNVARRRVCELRHRLGRATEDDSGQRRGDYFRT